MRQMVLLLALMLVLNCETVVAKDKQQKTWLLTEESLLGAITERSPEVSRIRAAEKRLEFDGLVLRQDYQASWISKAEHQDSEEEAFASFIPTFGPTYRLSTGVSKRAPLGVDLNSELFIDQQSTKDGVIDAATRTGLQLTLSIDLWQNFLGRLDKATLRGSSFQLAKQKLQAEIERKMFALELRKLYWSIVANNEQTKVSQELLEIAQRQLKEGRDRRRKYIADRQEIARYQAQVADREFTLLSLEYQRGLFIQQIKEQLPQIATSEVVLGGYDKQKTIQDVLVCVNQIEGSEGIPWTHTKWDEVIALVEKDFEEKKVEAARYASPDLKFESDLQVSSVDRGVDSSFGEFVEGGKFGYNLALILDVPIGDTRSKAEKALIAADYANFVAEKQRIEGQMLASHTQIVSLVKILRFSVSKLRENNRNLRISIDEMNKKFRQARVSVNELIQDQDALLQGLLSEIEANLRVIHTLLDYFKVFTDNPCSINSVKVS